MPDGGTTDDATPTIKVDIALTNAVAGDTVQLYDGTTKLGSAVTLGGTDISNGFVNITTATLANGDEVQIGKFRLVFLTGPKSAGHDDGAR